MGFVCIHTVFCHFWMLFRGYALCMCWDMAMHVLGEFGRGLVVSGAAVCTRLLLPSGTLCYDVLACLAQLAKLGDSWLGCYT